MKKILLLSIAMFCAIAAVAQKDTKTGDVVFLPEGEGLPRITANTKIVYIDKDPSSYGNPVITDVKSFSDGIAAYKDSASKKWGTIDTLGNVMMAPYLIPEFGEPLPVYVNGYAFVKAPKGERGFHIIDKKGKVFKKLPNIYKIDSKRNVDGYVGVLYYGDAYKGSKYGYIDSQGNPKFPAVSETMKYAKAPEFFGFSDGLTPFLCQSKRLWGFFNEKGEIVIPAQYYKVRGFSDGVAAVVKEKNGKWGFIDSKGDVALDFKYSIEPTDFSHGLAIVVRTTDKTKCIINKSGEIVKEHRLDIGGFTKSGVALIKTGAYQTELINTNFETIKSFGGMPVMSDLGKDRFFDYDTFFVLKPSGWTASYVTDRDLNVIFKAYSIENFNNGLAFVLYDEPGKGRQSAFVNPQGEIVILFRYNEF